MAGIAPRRATPAHPDPGVVTLGQVAPRLSVLEVSCNRCERRGRLTAGRLLAKHGPALPLPDLRRIIAADCPRMQAAQVGVVSVGKPNPGLSRLDHRRRAP